MCFFLLHARTKGFWNQVFLCSPGQLEIYYVDKAGSKLSEIPPASASLGCDCVLYLNS